MPLLNVFVNSSEHWSKDATMSTTVKLDHAFPHEAGERRDHGSRGNNHENELAKGSCIGSAKRLLCEKKVVRANMIGNSPLDTLASKGTCINNAPSS